MRLFALSDPHLSFGTPDKLMDRFGPHWVGHAAKIERAWRERVAATDVVLVPGDISWAMSLEQAKPDLDFLARLPGTKVLGKGNHDYWWSTITKLRAALPPGMHALQGDAIRIGDVAIGGTRLWDVPGVSFRDAIEWQPMAGGGKPISAEPSESAAAETQRLFERELGRLERSLESLVEIAGDSALPICATHYPPCGGDLASTPATRAIEQSGARHAVFGHLHSLKRAPLFGTREGVTYTLAACDWIDFAPIVIAEV